MLITATKMHYQWGCEKAIRLGASNWDAMNRTADRFTNKWALDMSSQMIF